MLVKGATGLIDRTCGSKQEKLVHRQIDKFDCKNDCSLSRTWLSMRPDIFSVNPICTHARRVEWAECSLVTGMGCEVQVFNLILDSSVGLRWPFSVLEIWSHRVWNLHSAEEDNLSPFDSKITCLCQSIEINKNKLVYMYMYVRMYVCMNVYVWMSECACIFVCMFFGIKWGCWTYGRWRFCLILKVVRLITLELEHGWAISSYRFPRHVFTNPFPDFSSGLTETTLKFKMAWGML